MSQGQGKAKGHDKQGQPPPTTPPPSGGGTQVVTSSTMAFALSPSTIVVGSNTCTVSGLDPGGSYDASTEYRVDGGGDSGSDGFNTGATVNEGDPGTYSWLFRLTDASPGSCRTWLRPKGSGFFDGPSQGPDGQPLEWEFHFNG